MIISKPIYGIMEIDLDRGVIWINSFDGYCIVRICQLNIKQKEEKFDTIDITKDKVVMETDSGLEKEDVITNFLNSTIEIISEKLSEIPYEDRKKYLTKLLTKLREEK